MASEFEPSCWYRRPVWVVKRNEKIDEPALSTIILARNAYITLAVEWSDESSLGVDGCSIGHLDFGGDVGVFGQQNLFFCTLSQIWCGSETYFTSYLHQSWSFVGVHEWETSGHWEANCDNITVVHFAVFELLSVAEHVGHFLNSSWQLFNSLVVEGEKTFGVHDGYHQLTFQLFSFVGFDVQKLGNLLCGPFVGLGFGLVLLASVLWIFRVLLQFRIIVLIIENVEKLIDAVDHGVVLIMQCKKC